MIFALDTNNYENLRITLTDEEYDTNISGLIEEFCFAMSSFFLEFAAKLDCNKKQADDLKEIILDRIGDIIECLLENDLLEASEDEVSEKEAHILTEEMENDDTFEADIANIVQLAEDCGGLASTKEYLRMYTAEMGIDPDKFYFGEY